VSDSFGPPVYQSRYWGQTSAAVDRTGSLACWAFGYGVGGHLQSIPNFAEVKSFPDFDNGVAFDATRDVVYGVSAVNGQIRGYDTKTFAQTFSVNIGERMDSFEQFDTGNLVASQNGRYLALITPTTLRVFDVVAHSVMALPTPSPRPVYNGRLANISTRAVVHTGDDIPIAGFIITGTTTKNVIVRGIGPSLTTAGIQGALQDPTLELYDGAGHLVATNNDWLQDHQGGTIGYYGLDPSDTRESAIFAALMPGAYTAVLRGNNGTTGVGLIEIYDIEPSSNSTLANISTRSVVGLDEDVMIAGFIVKDSLAKVVCRALGPSLTRFGVTGALADPSLELHDSQGTILRFNDNWETQGAEVWNTGLGPSNYAESAIVTDLSPGNYTAIVRTIDGTQGMGLVEVYRVN
jgi:hypothetical protein